MLQNFPGFSVFCLANCHLFIFKLLTNGFSESYPQIKCSSLAVRKKNDLNLLLRMDWWIKYSRQKFRYFFWDSTVDVCPKNCKNRSEEWWLQFMNASSELSKKYFKKMNASPIYNFGRRIGSGKRYSIYTLGLIVK